MTEVDLGAKPLQKLPIPLPPKKRGMGVMLDYRAE